VITYKNKEMPNKEVLEQRVNTAAAASCLVCCMTALTVGRSVGQCRCVLQWPSACHIHRVSRPRASNPGLLNLQPAGSIANEHLALQHFPWRSRSRKPMNFCNYELCICADLCYIAGRFRGDMPTAATDRQTPWLVS